MALPFKKDLEKYKEIDEDEILDKLSEEELKQLESALDEIDPEVRHTFRQFDKIYLSFINWLLCGKLETLITVHIRLMMLSFDFGRSFDGFSTRGKIVNSIVVEVHLLAFVLMSTSLLPQLVEIYWNLITLLLKQRDSCFSSQNSF